MDTMALARWFSTVRSPLSQSPRQRICRFGLPRLPLGINARARIGVAVVVMACLANPVVAQPATPPPPSPSVIGQFVKGLAPGTYVRLKLTTGTKVKGMVIATDDDAVTVKPRTRIPEPALRVMLDEIADAEIGGGTMVGKAVAIGAGVGAGAALGVMFLLVLLYGSD
jgi:hypothetical protein